MKSKHQSVEVSGERTFFLQPKVQLWTWEIGTGNGFHFVHQVQNEPHRNLIGIDLKYKPLAQTLRRLLKNQGEEEVNARVVRFHAKNLGQLFEPQEIDNIYIHFPDPWLGKKARKKNRIIQQNFMEELFQLQKQETFIELKTDSREYFDQMVGVCEGSQYLVREKTYDLHNSEYADGNFVTGFERFFLSKGLPIHYMKLVKN